ncbi:fructose-specific PTS transporter subunit EIIC [Bacillus sp. AFS017336]|uniref:fructose-specific PTS transporter subunit EIIC n=1 Tax=Bacillus sp. AFS017336 TaxID=2033489 RepID=UPI000BEFC6AA|nr:fructose-specific PTS transporter subunit EIIC [Bacillus sp. AFS017336]PEL13571.1 PTS fructose transporter subunit IIABC [Bacillus sp. AFS017336]
MDLTKMTSENLVFLDKDWKSKEEVLNNLVEELDKQGYLANKEEFKLAVLKREQISATGMEAGLAIPHGKSNAVKKAGFAFARLNNPIKDWESIDPANEVKYVFLLAIPESEAGSTHLELLAELCKRLIDQNYYTKLVGAKSVFDFIHSLENEVILDNEQVEYTKKIVAVTACAAGIAHTYMAAEALEKAGKELGVQVLVEKQGANGIEDRITKELLNGAHAVIFATDIAAKDKSRFNGLPYIQRRVADPLRNGKEMIEKVLNEPDGIVQDNAGEEKISGVKQTIFSQIYQGVLTGISYMIPVIVAAGLMIGIGQLGAGAFGLGKVIGDVKYATDPNEIIVILHYLGLFGAMIMKFMYPVFAAFLAYSIADRPGLAPGFVGGAFAGGLHYILWGVDGGIPSGFFGALILGITAGFVAKFLNEKIKLHKNLQAMKPMFFIPGITVLVIFFLNFFVVDPVFGHLNAWLQELIVKNQDSGEILLSIIIACLTAFDLGGPVNKAAGAIAIGLAADHIFPLTPRVLAIVIPPIGIGLATILDKYIVKRRVFDENLRVTGTTSLILGFIAIGEGAIPFMLRNPIITISINLIGASLGAVTAVTLGAVQWYPLPAIWGWPLVENFWAYALGIIVGTLFIAFANIFVRYYLIKKNEKKAELN